MTLKQDMEGPNGFIKILTDEMLPKPKNMAEMALKKYQESGGEFSRAQILENFSDILSGLIKTEYNLFKEYEKIILEKSLNKFSKIDEFKDKYPEINNVFTSVKSILKETGDEGERISKINGMIAEYNKILSFSLIQSAKTRAGQSLENHMEVLFRKLGFSFEPQKSLIAGEVLDFIFPNIRTAKEDPHSSMVTECQTTLKDRFRLSLGKIPRGSAIKKYILTAAGKGLITGKDISDLTPKKIEEIKNKGWKLVVFKEVKYSKFKNNPTVISYEELVQKHYPSISSLW
jgi:EcoRII C terminal